MHGLFKQIGLMTVVLFVLPGGSALAAHGVGPTTNAAIHGVWRNSYNSVDVRIDDCGSNVCGVVVGATAEALNDAKDSGYPNLMGMELLRDYHADSARRWSGTVFVPDLGHSFSSHIDMIDATHARIAGCLWHQFICKSQIWRRL